MREEETASNSHFDILSDPGLPPKETQRILGCGSTKYWELLRTGELDAYYIGKSPRVTTEAIRKYREKHRKKSREEI